MPDHSLLHEARDVLPEAVRLRRRLHARPEVGLDLPFTQEAVLTALADLPVTVATGSSTSSVVATLEGSHPGPTVLLRGDMDALPMPEDTGLPYASEIDGAMHACGHDTHVAMLAGAAQLLAGRRNDMAGRVVMMFQPGEEGHHGARFMLEEGLLDVGPLADGSPSPISGAFALHITSLFPSGTINLRGGTMMASSDTMRIVVRGRGGHASAPHQAVDPIPVACEVVQAIQTMVTRRIDVFDPGVVTVGQITAGTTSNVIPETAMILGTIRAVSERTRRRVHDGVRRVAEGVAAAHEAGVEVDIELGYPVTINDLGYAGFTSAVAIDLLGANRVTSMPAPVMGAEDFSYVLQEVPGALAFLGATPPGVNPRQAAPNHSNRVLFDEDAMATGIAMYAQMALAHVAGDGPVPD
ncbi:MAG TPA: M20 family metallopeptidase [Acidimicrobiales bacterium]